MLGEFKPKSYPKNINLDAVKRTMNKTRFKEAFKAGPYPDLDYDKVWDEVQAETKKREGKKRTSNKEDAKDS